MTFDEMEVYLLNIPKFGKKHSIDAVGETLVNLGVEQESFQIIHVAGTNGKGSVCAFLNSIFLSAGKTVGLFTSPHLIQIRERFLINGEMASKEKVIQAFYHVMERMERENHPNFFEMMFYIGMYLFTQEKVEYVILETGLGGRLDATNCIQKPMVTILTRIGKDHEQYLGTTLEAITREKVGIMKEGVPMVCLEVEERPSISHIIRQQALEKNVSLFTISTREIQNYRIHHKKIDFLLDSSYYRSIRVTIPSIALYQVENVALVLKSMELLATKLGITKEEIVQGIACTKWAGRMEEVMPNIYVDGAHNVDGIYAFIETIRLKNRNENVLLFAVVDDKDYERMVQAIAESTLFEKVLVSDLDTKRGMKSKAIADIFQRYGFQNVVAMESIEEAFKECCKLQQEDKNIYIVGSLYLVGTIKTILENMS
ncbi:MAG: Mur ligase family protein [Eubacteriales bacterium]